MINPRNLHYDTIRENKVLAVAREAFRTPYLTPRDNSAIADALREARAILLKNAAKRSV